MIVISYKTLRSFGVKNRNAIDSLHNWFTIMEKSNFANFNEMRSVFNSVDAVEMIGTFSTSKGIITGL